MREITFALDDRSGHPVFVQLARSIVAAIESGRLQPGCRLPGTRALARTLKLHRNTVDAAYHEALMQGWLVSEPSRGTFVARDLPEMIKVSERSGPGRSIHRETDCMPASPAEGPATLHVSDGAPDPRLLPKADLARAFRRALVAPDFLHRAGYGGPLGAPILREALCEHMSSERGLVLSPDDILVTRGSQMALFLAAGALLVPGETIAVEEPGYPLAAAAFRAVGARVIGVPVDAEGILIDYLDGLAGIEPTLRAVYVTPHHQYPTTVTLGAARRIRLLDLARRHGLTIVEDDYDHEYRFDGKPVLPLAARAADVPVVYVGSLSKVLAPGLRLGYVTAPATLLRRMADRRQVIDRQGDVPLEHAVAALLREGDLGRHVRKTRRIYQARRDLLGDLLRDQLWDWLDFDVPAGGLALWARPNPSLNIDRWHCTAHRLGLALPILPDRLTASLGFRIGFASLDDDELRQAVRLLHTACRML